MQQVTLTDVSRVYGRLFALHRVSAEFRAGTITAIAGDNGSGKTTLLKLVATLEPPTNGQINYDDISREAFADNYHQKIGWLPHAPLLYDNLTGRENLEFFSSMYGLNADTVDERIDRLIETVGMREDADRRVQTYSRGMRQRMTIARALIPDPELLLFDEPLTGLDRDGRKDISQLLNNLRDDGRIIAIASHDLANLDELTDRLIILRSGKVAFDAPLDGRQAAELYAEHA